MPRFAAGVIRFQNEVFPNKKALFEQLSKGQSPEALFITCSDSRIETAMLTQTEPGDLFISRNAGNIVPPHTSTTGGTTAAIEFATTVLNVPHIIICGHTECGAMKGAMNPESLVHLPHVKQWLGYAKAAVDVTAQLAGGKSADEQMNILLQQNVILQLQHLRTHPSVAVRLAKGDLELHGWVYDIKTGHVDAYDEKRQCFVSVPEHYAAAIKQHKLAHATCS